MCSPKEYHQKSFRRNGVSASKNTLKPPPQTILKKGGVPKPPTLSDFSEPPPPPPVCYLVVLMFFNVRSYLVRIRAPTPISTARGPLQAHQRVSPSLGRHL